MSRPKKTQIESKVLDDILDDILNSPPASPEPAKNPELGDLTPELIDWRKENWPAGDFNKLYPPARLRAIGRE